ncbi:hypothetical protein AB5J62_12870 [Amycolatopsis sp. cg5]|uniref:hypothetical protein n=1 Tax=Amycolatopsis sp. cg5 TaxID=3238802 RepID=UPI00352579E0
MEIIGTDVDLPLDLWAEEADGVIAADGCCTNCVGSAGCAGSASTPFSTTSTGGTASTASTGC